MHSLGAAWDRGPGSGFRIKLTGRLSSITSMPHVTTAKPPSLSQNNGYKVLSTSWHRQRASYIVVLSLKSCLAIQPLRPRAVWLYADHFTSLSLGSSPSKIRVSCLERQRFCFRGNPSASQGTIWITSPWQGAAQATRCFVLQWKPCTVVILLTGDRVVAGQVAGRKHSHLGQVCPCSSWAQREADPRARGLWPRTSLEELFIISGCLIVLGAVSWLVEAGQVGTGAWGRAPVDNSKGPSFTCLG